MADHMNAQSAGSSGGMGMHGMMTGADGGFDPAKLDDMRQHMKQQVQMMNQSHGCMMAADAGR